MTSIEDQPTGEIESENRMKLGFTGTRFGMTDAQKAQFSELVIRLRPSEFHHGDCIGADDEAATIVHALRPSCRIVSHPPSDGSHRAFNPHSDEERPSTNHFARNRDIVNETDELAGAPMLDTPQKRGGTWYTIEYARKRVRIVHQLWREFPPSNAWEGVPIHVLMQIKKESK